MFVDAYTGSRDAYRLVEQVMCIEKVAQTQHLAPWSEGEHYQSLKFKFYATRMPSTPTLSIADCPLLPSPHVHHHTLGS